MERRRGSSRQLLASRTRAALGVMRGGAEQRNMTLKPSRKRRKKAETKQEEARMAGLFPENIHKHPKTLQNTFSCCLPRTVRPPNCSRTIRPQKSTPELFANCSTRPPNCSRTVRPNLRTVRELFDPLAEQFANSATQLAISWLAYRVSLRTLGSLIRIQTSKFKGK
jgi:hypothetical protein